MHKLFLTLLLGVLSFSAIGKANPLIASPTKDSIFKQVFHVREGEYDLYIISTCIIGIGEVPMGNFILGGRSNSLAMLEQEFIFTKNERTIKQCFSPVRKIRVTTASGQTYSFLESPVNTVNVLVKNNEVFYDFWSLGFEDLAPDIDLVYNINGDLIIYNCQSDFKIIDTNGFKAPSPGYDFELNKDGYKHYNELRRSAIEKKSYYNKFAFAMYYSPYSKED